MVVRWSDQVGSRSISVNRDSELGGVKTGRCLGNQSRVESRLERLVPGRVEMREGVTRG